MGACSACDHPTYNPRTKLPLPAGSRLGPYEVLAPLGAGGMGEVYKARDTRLARTVAIKVLSADVSGDVAARARFEREARAIATLSHPHICVVYDVGHQAPSTGSGTGIDYLVMELLEGETLAERIARAKGPMPIPEVLTIGAAIADALDKAHRAGIVHRDLKPLNVMLTKSGPKLLDFGLAKLQGSASVVAMSDESGATTVGPRTGKGTILGTIHYMSPEQVEGREADSRSDIWALGAVLYEMATGQRPFEGESPAGVLGAIMGTTPPAISTRQPLTPTSLEHLVQHCLEKHADERWQSAADVRSQLQWISRPAHLEAPGVPRRSVSPIAVGAALASASVAVLLLGARTLWRASPVPDQSITRSIVEAPALSLNGARNSSLLALSPDGTRLVYVGSGPRPRLLVRRLDQFEPTPIAGTDDASSPFFSPSGDFVGFFAQGKLKKVGFDGGAPLTLADAPSAFGGTWTEDDTIVFAPDADGLMRVSGSGGTPQRLTKVPPSGVVRHSWPSFVPGSNAILYTVNDTILAAHIDLIRLSGGPSRTVVTDGAFPQIVAGGYLVYANTSRAGSLSVIGFDERRMTPTGTPASLVDGVMASAQASQFALSRAGTLVYVSNASLPQRTLVWVDRSGRTSPALADAMSFGAPRIAPDGQRFGFITYDGLNPRYIWVYDPKAGAPMRLVSDGRTNTVPEWTPDGRRLAFASIRETSGGQQNVFTVAVDGSGSPERLTMSERAQTPASWSPDGRSFVFQEAHPGTQNDIMAMDAVGERTVRPLLVAPGNQLGTSFSPDGRYLAYSSDEGGRPEIFVTNYPRPGTPRQISTEGGMEPTWSHRGELFFRNGERMMVVRVADGSAGLTFSTPLTLFEGRFEFSILTPGIRAYDVDPSGQRFLMIKSPGSVSVERLYLVTNWRDDVARALGGARQ